MSRENDLFKAFLDGDKSSFEQIVISFKDNLIYFINRYVHSLSLAEEIAEDSFVALLLHKNSFNFKYSVKTYLFAIGKNKALNVIKKNKRHRQEPLSDFEYSLQDNFALEEKVLENERKRMINACLGRIKSDYSSVLYLYYFEQMDKQECSKILKKSKKQIENLLYRGREALKKELEKEGIGYEI